MARRRFSKLASERTVLLDGAMGTALISRGLTTGQCSALWNVERPESVLEVLQSYVDAGCDVVQTNTFGASASALAQHGLEGRLVELNTAGAKLARTAARDRALVAGNIGPSGRLLEPYGDASESELEKGFRLQAAILAEAGVDYLSVETMIDLREAIAALMGALATGLEVTVCMTYDRRPNGFFTLMGQRPAECSARLADVGAVAVGANCSLASADMLALCPELVEAGRVPVIVKPNAGLPDLEEGLVLYHQDPSDFARDVAAMVEMGARAAGGCCGTDEGFIRSLALALGRTIESGGC